MQQGYRIVPNINVTTKSEGGTRQAGPPGPPVQTEETDGESRFQYILAAPTSILTKPGDPSLTYINQGQSYEIKIKKLGDISGNSEVKFSNHSTFAHTKDIIRRSGCGVRYEYVSMREGCSI